MSIVDYVDCVFCWQAYLHNLTLWITLQITKPLDILRMVNKSSNDIHAEQNLQKTKQLFRVWQLQHLACCGKLWGSSWGGFTNIDALKCQIILRHREISLSVFKYIYISERRNSPCNFKTKICRSLKHKTSYLQQFQLLSDGNSCHTRHLFRCTSHNCRSSHLVGEGRDITLMANSGLQ